MKQTLVLVFSTVTLFVAAGVNGDLSFAAMQEFNVTRTECGVTKLCVGMPDTCDPAESSTCFFGSVNVSSSAPPNGVEMTFELSGHSSGFIALGLTANASEGTSELFVCAKNSSGSFFFQTMTLNNNNNTLTPLNMNVTEIRGQAINDTIQCQFSVPSLNASSTRSAADTTYVLLLGSGTVNGDSIGNFTQSKTTSPLNLRDPTSNIASTTAAPNTAAPNTTTLDPTTPNTTTPDHTTHTTTPDTTTPKTTVHNTTTPDATTHNTNPGSGANNGPHAQAVLLLLSVLTLFFLKTA